MNKEIFSRVFPNEFILKHIRSGERPDGRSLSEFRKVVIEKSTCILIVEKVTPTQIEVYCAIGSTIAQASFSANQCQRGVLGSARSAQNPITINFTGDDNLKGQEFYQPFTLARFIKNQVLKTMGDEFKELRPEKDTFTTLNFDIRLLLDDGNHAGAFLISALTCFYIYLNQLTTNPNPTRILNELHNYYFPCTIGLYEQKSKYY